MIGHHQSIGGPTKKILVADDDPIIIKLLQVNLEMEGYEVVCARDGQDAVEKAQMELPDLIILDIMMPRMDGWSARAALLDLPSVRDTPVIFLSARAQQADLRRGYEAGVAEYVTKPFDPMDLLATIRRIIASGPSDLSTGEGSNPSDPSSAEGSSRSETSSPGNPSSGEGSSPNETSSPSDPSSGEGSSPNETSSPGNFPTE